MLEDDPFTEEVVLIGEIGGTSEEEAAEFIGHHMDKPVVAYIAGRTAPPGKKMGHAGAIISQGRGSSVSKIEALERGGARVAARPADVVRILKHLDGR
jgi:succinyl-CoA synthetase alpha subunit